MTLTADLLGLMIATVLTLFVFSYLLGDNFLYRLAVAILAGGSVAYIGAIALWNVIVPLLLRVLQDRQVDPVGWSFAVAGAVLGVLILFKGFPRLAWLGNFSMAYLIGVGAGVAIGGAALGTLFAQSRAVATSQGAMLPILDPLIMLAVTLTVFISFTFVAGSRRGLGGLYTRVVQTLAGIGRLFLALTFGIVFASLYIASVSVLISRIQFIAEAIGRLSGTLGISF